MVLAPDGSTVALAPLFAGIEVGLKRAMGWPGPTDQPYSALDVLYAVTITEALGTSFLLARVNGTAALGPDGCWDDVDNPQNFTLLGPPSLVPNAVANGAMDGVLLGTHLAEEPIPLSILFRRYYGVGNGITSGWPHSSRRRRDFGALMAVGKLEEEVAVMLRVLRGLSPTCELLEEVGEQEEADIARRAAQEFMEAYVGDFVVGSDGYLYQGRGWHWVGAHTRGHNSKGYGVGYVGNFSSSLPDPDAIALVRDGLIPCAVRAGWLHQNYTLHGHRQMVNTSCPGDALFQEIRTWHGFKMEVEKPPQSTEPPTLLKTYRWRTAAPMGERDPDRCPASPGGWHWGRLQGWKRSYSQPESDSLDDGVGKGGSNFGAPKASARRSLFQRAFSAPSKVAKEPRGPEGGKGTLQKYLRSMSKKKGHVENGVRADKGSHEGVPDPEERRTAGKGTDSDGSTSSQFSNVKGLLWKRLRERKGRIVPRNESSAAVSTDGERAPSRSGSHESLLPAPSAAELDLSGENIIVRPVHGSIVGEKFCFQVTVLGRGECQASHTYTP
ncbi:UNVERIFIED_CONTAM: hypothetical protein H355_010737 [Colinus virginianus]|nr:hypothetical protein H355_010737 [Colinus virginianus]